MQDFPARNGGSRKGRPGQRNVIVYTNQPSVTLFLNGQAIGTMEAKDHACEFANLPLAEGENRVWAEAGALTSNTIVICPVEVPNPAYTYPRGENDVPVGNWFDGAAIGTSDDDMEFPEGCFHVKDTARDIMGNAAAAKVLVAALADIGAFGPITAVRTSAMPIPLDVYLPMVGNLPAGGLSYVNKQLNSIRK